MAILMPVLLVIVVLGTTGRATLPLADPTLEQPSEWQLVRGLFDFGGTLAPCGSYRACATQLEQCVVAVVIVIPSLQVSTSPNIQYDASTSGDCLNI